MMVDVRKLLDELETYVAMRTENIRPINSFREDVRHELTRMITAVGELIDPMGDERD